jgi:hypothetical protein
MEVTGDRVYKYLCEASGFCYMASRSKYFWSLALNAELGVSSHINHHFKSMKAAELILI